MRGIFPSRFDGTTTHASKGERRFIRACTLSSSVVDLRTQPLVLRIAGLRDRGDYTPDAAVALRLPGSSITIAVLVECKPANEAAQREVIAIHDHIRETLARIGLRFVVMTDAMLSASLDSNFDRVLRHRLFGGSKEVRRILELTVRRGRFEHFGELQHAVGTVHALHALASGWLHFDVFEPLVADSPLATELPANWDAVRELYR